MSDSIIHAALHPYRFAWCESCDTAAGNFCEAFGVPAQDLSTNDFITAGLVSTAFLGCKNEIEFNPSSDEGGLTSWDQRSIMYNIFLSSFLGSSGYSLAALVYFAQNNIGPFGPGNSTSTLFRMDPSATSYGATDLQYADPW